MKEDIIKLGDFLKIENICQSGGEAKMLIQSGQVKLNGEIETRRGKKLSKGDRITIDNKEYIY